MKWTLAILGVVAVTGLVQARTMTKRQSGGEPKWPAEWMATEGSILVKACPLAIGLVSKYAEYKFEKNDAETADKIEQGIRDIFPLVQCANLEATREFYEYSAEMKKEDPKNCEWFKYDPLPEVCEHLYKSVAEEADEFNAALNEIGLDNSAELDHGINRTLRLKVFFFLFLINIFCLFSH
ncbi:hypothetical protein MAR_032591 [Mya arenaria]|uniref:Uncharacterized protein n=1 Tax=Mya arenaria TaxID=6604 RepID=A0ABY7FAE9_MYAAR|nr:hypothetical protein MAR_032591 [Mya arenaria]